MSKSSFVAPTAIQFIVEVPPNATNVSLRWHQENTGFGQFAGGDAAIPRVLLQEIEGPIEWRYEGVNNDILATDGERVFLKHMRIDAETLIVTRQQWWNFSGPDGKLKNYANDPVSLPAENERSSMCGMFMARKTAPAAPGVPSNMAGRNSSR